MILIEVVFSLSPKKYFLCNWPQQILCWLRVDLAVGPNISKMRDFAGEAGSVGPIRKDGLRRRAITNLTVNATSQMFANGASYVKK